MYIIPGFFFATLLFSPIVTASNCQDVDFYPGNDIYSVFFFIELKVFVNLTYLYLSEIKKQVSFSP